MVELSFDVLYCSSSVNVFIGVTLASDPLTAWINPADVDGSVKDYMWRV